MLYKEKTGNYMAIIRPISLQNDKKSIKSSVCFIYPQFLGLGLLIFIISFGDGAKSLAKTKCRGNET